MVAIDENQGAEMERMGMGVIFSHSGRITFALHFFSKQAVEMTNKFTNECCWYYCDLICESVHYGSNGSEVIAVGYWLKGWEFKPWWCQAAAEQVL